MRSGRLQAHPPGIARRRDARRFYRHHAGPAPPRPGMRPPAPRALAVVTRRRPARARQAVGVCGVWMAVTALPRRCPSDSNSVCYRRVSG